MTIRGAALVSLLALVACKKDTPPAPDPPPAPGIAPDTSRRDEVHRMRTQPPVPYPTAPACARTKQRPAPAGVLATTGPEGASPMNLMWSSYELDRVISLEPFLVEVLDAAMVFPRDGSPHGPRIPSNMPITQRGRPSLAAGLDPKALQFGALFVGHEMEIPVDTGPELGMRRAFQIEEIITGDVAFFTPPTPDVDRSGVIARYVAPSGWQMTVHASGHFELWEDALRLSGDLSAGALEALMDAYGAVDFDAVPDAKAATISLGCARWQGVAAEPKLEPLAAAWKSIHDRAVDGAEPTLWAVPVAKLLAWPASAVPLGELHEYPLTFPVEKMKALLAQPLPSEIAAAIHGGTTFVAAGSSWFSLGLSSCGTAKGCTPDSYGLVTLTRRAPTPAWPRKVELGGAADGVAIPRGELADQAFYDTLATPAQYLAGDTIYEVRAARRAKL